MQTDAQLCELVANAYLDPATVSGPNDEKALLFDNDDELVIAITGTKSLPGWVCDFEFWPENDVRLGRVHRGFLRNGVSLWGLLKDRILAASLKGQKITIAGHSLGAVEGQIIAAEALAIGFKGKIRLVGFGSPRWALWSNHTVRRLFDTVPVKLYKRASDPVPHVPFSRLLWFIPWYGHIRENIVIGASLPSSDWTFPLDPVNDKNHGVLYYLKDMQAKCE